jgi:peptidoglycan/LPS O-acetylase OafA/YrhL
MPEYVGQKETTYKPQLDGLRAFAVTAVAFYHVNPSILPGGWLGVDVFFVLSGYLITTTLRKEMNTNNTISLKNFYIRRLLRLTPAFWTLLAFVFFFVLTFSSQKRTGLISILISATYMMNWNRAFAWFPQGLLGHTWSLAMEEQFYLIWPLILILFGRRSSFSFIVIDIIIINILRISLVLLGVGAERTYDGFDTHSDAILMGCALSIGSMNLNFIEACRRLMVIPMIILALLLFLAGRSTAFTQTFGLSFVQISAGWIIVVALQEGWVSKFLSLAPFVYTGRISYGWYLWHFPILTLGMSNLPANWGHRSMIGAFLVAISYGIAAASFKFIETPFLRLKSQFSGAV